MPLVSLIVKTADAKGGQQIKTPAVKSYLTTTLNQTSQAFDEVDALISKIENTFDLTKVSLADYLKSIEALGERVNLPEKVGFNVLFTSVPSAKKKVTHLV